MYPFSFILLIPGFRLRLDNYNSHRRLHRTGAVFDNLLTIIFFDMRRKRWKTWKKCRQSLSWLTRTKKCSTYSRWAGGKSVPIPVGGFILIAAHDSPGTSYFSPIVCDIRRPAQPVFFSLTTTANPLLLCFSPFNF